MPSPHERLTYRASQPLASAPHIVVEADGGRVQARVERRRTEQHRPVWHWSGDDVEPFAVEDEGALQSFLVTRGDGAPFGRIRVRGWLRMRLEATDARAVQTVVQADGRVCADDGKQIGRVELRSPEEAVVELDRVDRLDPTRRLLVLAMPVCQAANAPLLLQ
jgi:hypothetical protein